MHQTRTWLIVAACLALPAPGLWGAESNAPLAQQGYDLLKKSCYRCHGIEFKVANFNVLDRASLLARRQKDENPAVTPGNLEQSALWGLVSDDEMPRGKPKLTADEKDTLRRWILAGAPLPGRQPRPFRGDKDVLTAVRDHLRQTDPEDRRFQRYFTLTHLYGNYQHVTDDELRLDRAALSKLINSLSWKPGLVGPKAVDAAGTVFVIDVRQVGWDEHDIWKEVLKLYPYGLTHNRAADEGLRNLAQEVYDLAGCDLPYVRADWFIATAARPPLYHTLLQLPKTAQELEQQLRVDPGRDFLRNQLARAGFMKSAVSRQNRLVDRHDAVYGAYWKSYDFKTNEGTGNLLNFPLGPVFSANPFPNQAFEQAGGELIFNLPNGLQGYLLINIKGERIDAGPIEIVRDDQETGGTPAVINGLSCMSCHKHGVIRFQDQLRAGSAVSGDALLKVQQLVRKQDDMNRLLDRDQERFLRALDEATGGFLKVGEDANKTIRDFPEPVGAVARLYVEDVNLEAAAYELGLDDPSKLKSLIESNRRLRQLGLGPLANGGTVKRDVWSSLQFTTSPFHNVARELGLGTPYLAF
jgi:serine/threonine-protein kinase